MHIHADHGQKWPNIEVTLMWHPCEMQVKHGSSVGFCKTKTALHGHRKEIVMQIIYYVVLETMEHSQAT